MKILLTLTAMALSTTVIASPFTSPSKPSAKIIMDHSQATKQLFAMNLVQVDGKNVQNRGGVVWLKPGDYDLSFSAKINQNFTKGQLTRSESRLRDFNNDMSLSVEAGKTYYLAYDAKDSDSKKWKPVVYKTN